jgi:ABC-2 type transport system permease protein
MKNIFVLTKRECLAYFYTPLAYVVMTGFLFFVGVFFYQIMSISPNSESMRDVLDMMSFISLIIMPMITMRLLAEDKRTGMFEMLMTTPITEAEIVISKFLGGFFFYLFLVLPTLIYVLLLILWGNPDLGALVSGYLGLILMGASFVAIGLFVSSLTANQIVAAIITFVILISGWILGWTASQISKGIVTFLNLILSWAFGKFDALTSKLTDMFGYLAFFEHLDAFRKGLIDSRDLIYFLSIITLFIFLTIRVVESKRWK